MKYNEDTEDAEAEGGVRVEQRGDILEGSRLKFNLASKTGELSQPSYRLKDASSRGYADHAFIRRGKSVSPQPSDLYHMSRRR